MYQLPDKQKPGDNPPLLIRHPGIRACYRCPPSSTAEDHEGSTSRTEAHSRNVCRAEAADAHREWRPAGRAHKRRGNGTGDGPAPGVAPYSCGQIAERSLIMRCASVRLERGVVHAFSNTLLVLHAMGLEYIALH